MDYYKYIKYKTKYLNLKYDNNQYGGGIVPCDKGYNNAFGTCWAVSLQTILSSGHLTSDQLNETMKSFQKDDGSVTAIKENSEKFIEQQIKEIQSNTELTNAFAHYKIFEHGKIDFLKDILRTFIERYYNKFMDIQFTKKPLGYINPRTNKQRCEYRIANDFQKLFDLSHLIERKSEFGEFVYGQYLFCNLLSIFFLDYKVSFRNYYNNFSSIEFDDKNDLGILISIKDHVCCLFICDGEKFYNDNNKKIYNCKWKDLLRQGTTGKQLYIIEGCLEFIDDIKTYKGDIKKISKVFYLTVISKHTKEDTTLDIDIKRLLEFTELDKIKDMEIQEIVGEHYDKKHQFYEALKFYDLAAKQGYYLYQYNLGIMLYKGEGGVQDYVQAREYFKLAADQGYANAQYMLGTMLYKGDGGVQDYVQAREYFKLAADQGHANAQYELGKMLYKGEGGEKNIIQAKKMLELAVKQSHRTADVVLKSILNNNTLDADILFILGLDLYAEHNFKLAREKFTFAANKGHATAQNKLGRMLYHGEGGEKDHVQAKNMFSLAAAQDNEAMYMLGRMLYYGMGGEKDYVQAKKIFESAADKGNKEAQFMLGFMLYVGEDGKRNIDQAKIMVDLAAKQNNLYGKELLKLISAEMAGENVAGAQFRLGHTFYSLYEHQLAKKMFELAANQGNTQAKEMLRNMSK
jgi:TPR repeat protein